MIKEKSKTWEIVSQVLGKIFAPLPFPPNLYTWLTLPTAFGGLLAIMQQKIILGVVLFLIAGILDIVDGAVARAKQQSSYLGAFLDGSLDRFIDFMLIFSYFWLNLTTPFFTVEKWICIATFVAIMPSFEVAYANHRRAVYDPEEKTIWRILNRGEMYVLMLSIPVCTIFSSSFAGYMLVGLVILAALTTLQTLVASLYHAKT